MNVWQCEHRWFEIRRWAEWSDTWTTFAGEMPEWVQWFAEEQCLICGLTQSIPVAGPRAIINHP